ncbi:MAG: LemA family protein [Sedimentisphaeraceae bacterium JB056]
MRHGGIGKFLLITLAVILIIGIAIFSWFRSGYDKAVAMDEQVKQAWSNVDTNLQRRFDLIPNLVNTVKGYAEHEKGIFESLAEARTKYFTNADRASKINAANEFSGVLSRLLMLQENYPTLKADQSFMALMDSLEGTENRISVERKRYNEAATALNSYRRSLFGSFFCSIANVEEAPYFEATEQAKTEVPEVKF